MSFLLFAAFIILITWVFQSTLLQVFFNAQTQRDISAVGQEMYDALSRLPLTENSELIDKYIRRQQSENPAAQIFLLNGEGELLYPMYTEKEEEYELSSPPSADMFTAIRSELDEHAEANAHIGVTVQKADGNFVFMAKVGSLTGTVLNADGGFHIRRL